MALKDLVAARGAEDEAAIERIVSAYVRYDVETRSIHFTPSFSSLSNRQKILVYLVALQGWRFVIDEAMPSEARPTEIEDATEIAGGSLRPTLGALRDSRMVVERNSHYSVRGVNFPAIEAELSGNGDAIAPRRVRPAAKRTSTRIRTDEDISGDVEDDEDDDVVADAQDDEDAPTTKRSKKVGSKTGNIAATFDRYIDEGFFDEPRTMADVQRRLRKEAIMVQQTSLPGYFLAAVRKGRLDRDEMEANGKTVWGYTTKKKST